MFCEDNKLVMVGLNSVESSIFSFNSEVAMNRDMESLIMEIKEYKLGIWKEFNEDYFVFVKKFFPFKTPPRRKLTMKAAKQQLMDFLEWHPLFRSASIGKIMSKLVCYFCPQEIRDRLASECVFSYNGAISYQPPSTSQTPFVSEVPSEDEEPQLALGNEPKNALQYNT